MGSARAAPAAQGPAGPPRLLTPRRPPQRELCDPLGQHRRPPGHRAAQQPQGCLHGEHRPPGPPLLPPLPPPAAPLSHTGVPGPRCSLCPSASSRTPRSSSRRVPPVPPSPRAPVQTPARAPGCGHSLWGCPCQAPLLVRGPSGCPGPPPCSVPGPQPGLALAGPGWWEEVRAAPADPAFFPLHQRSWVDPQDGPSRAINMQMSRENPC